MSSPCPHRRKQLGRVVCRDGRTLYAEKCLDCGENPRGPGVWVSHAEAIARSGGPPNGLPLFADYRHREAASGQRSLFEGLP